MSAEKINTNVLIVGKSGVGKSSLINYLFNANVEKTGSGKPVTEFGTHLHIYDYDENFTIGIYDSSGIEPGTHESKKWKDMVLKEVHAHEKKNISEWFNTIIFCFSKDNRAEDFELDTLKKIIAENNNVTAVITHCDYPDQSVQVDSKANAIKKRIMDETGIDSDSIIYVCSVNKKTIGGKQNVQFGKDKVFTVIIRNLWSTFKKKVPQKVKNEFLSDLKEKSDYWHKDLITEKLFTLFSKKSEKIHEVEDLLNSEFEGFITRECEKVNDTFRDAFNYYNRLSQNYLNITLIDSNAILDEKSDWKFDAFKNYKKEIDDAIDNVSSFLDDALSNINIYTILTDEIADALKKFSDVFAALKMNYSTNKEIRDKLHKAVDKYIDNVKEVISIRIAEITAEIQDSNIENIYIDHIEKGVQ